MKTIINADDFGRSESINDAIVYAFKNGIINQTTLMVNMPYVEEAILEAKKNHFDDKVGLHLNLDEGFPLTDKIKKCSVFCNSDGRFNGFFRQSRIKQFYLNGFERRCCREEIRAQISKYEEYGLNLQHIDSHHHVHTIISILPIVIDEAKKMKLKSMRVRFNLQVNGFFKRCIISVINKLIKKHFLTTAYFCDSVYYIENKPQLSSLEVMCHPDIIDGKYVDVIGKRSYGITNELNNLQVL
ncbi:MAG: ChbG/HpnK family deacetylase [Bacteroides sp.]